MLTKGVLFHQGNAPLAPSDDYLPTSKKFSEKWYQSDGNVISAVENYFEGWEETFKTGIQMFIHRWKKCVDLKGDYVEK